MINIDLREIATLIFQLEENTGKKSKVLESGQGRQERGFTATQLPKRGPQAKSGPGVASEGAVVEISQEVNYYIIILDRLFSSPEPSGSQGELIVYPCSVVRPSVRRPSVVRPSVVHHFQRSSSLKQLGQSKPNFT